MSEARGPQDEVQALLVCIEPLAKACVEHEPEEGTLKWTVDNGVVLACNNVCKHCGVKLRAKWEEVKE
jgi:hypothetical protein